MPGKGANTACGRARTEFGSPVPARGVSRGCLHLYSLWGGAAAASPAWQRGALLASLAALKMLRCYFPWKSHFCGIVGSVSADVREI